MPHDDDYVAFQKKFDDYFYDSSNHQTHYPPNLQDLCVFDSNGFKRCKIIGIDKEW